MDDKKIKKPLIAFAAIDKYITDNIPSSKEVEVKGKEMISWGDNNDFPQYLKYLFNNSTTLKAICTTISDFVVGDECLFERNILNDRGEDIEDIVRQIALSYCVYGGFALNITRNRVGDISGVYVLDFSKVRSNKYNTEFYYSDDFGEKSFGRVKYNIYPKFDNMDKAQFSSIFYYKNDKHQTYPMPLYGGCLMSVECEIEVQKYNLNSIKSGFSGGLIVSMNNGSDIDEEVMNEIERNFEEKFCGSSNAGRTMLTFSNGKESAPTIAKIDTVDFAQKFDALVKASKQDLYTAYRIHPVLLGNVLDGSAFSDQDFSESFKLFNRTQIKALQKIICNVFWKIFNKELKIKQFSIDWNKEEKSEVVQ